MKKNGVRKIIIFAIIGKYSRAYINLKLRNVYKQT